MLEQISSSGDIKKLSTEQRKQLCREIREFLVHSVSKTGGHLASNLGVVELTVALHSVFDIPEDKFVWDVGHQSYVNKLLTGRRAGFETLRKFGGMSGFPKRSESPADVFDTGHSSTSISAALGLARARELEKKSYSVGAIFGDGALTGGMMYEAMNDAGRFKSPLILILNDNNMSISKNVGSISKYLRALRIKPGYSRFKKKATSFLDKIPVVGNPLYNMISNMKHKLQRILLQNTIFENFGFEYFGPVDGHDLDGLINVFRLAKSKQKPVFVHIRTKKGKGYPPAEHHPDTFHGIGPFCAETGRTCEPGRDYSAAFGGAVFDAAAENDKVVGITAAMPVSTGMEMFSRYFKDRFFDVGIAEQHGVTMAAGLAAGGYVPVFPVYSSFLQRAYDQILHDVCLQNLHVVFGVDRAGAVGADGETHQGIYDIAFMNSMPNMTVLSPCNYTELEEMVRFAANECTGPVAIRYPRGCMQFDGGSFVPGRANVVADGNEITVYATGRMMNTAAEVRTILGDGVRIVEITTVKPLDTETVLKAALPFSCVIEDGVAKGGLGEAIGALFAEKGITGKFRAFGYPDEPVVQGSVDELDRKYGIDPRSIAEVLSEMKG
ncbi:MAG: 1-deoxy-D-xylulose-5-phosphate synthase [Clostridia bacterium]|nr:1-deoxy-D-xylulose-5-phosphate synthase [Clostridia bacterium]